MRVAITEGPLADALAAAVTASGDAVLRLVRHRPGPGERSWDPPAGRIAAPGLADVDAVVNLWASSPWRRWSEAVRTDLRATRTTGTLTVVSALEPDGRCQRFLNLSSVAFYGDGGPDELTGDSPRGSGFFADITAEWEAAARHAPVPTALLRTPYVLRRRAGYLDHRRRLWAQRLGSGRQYVPWVHVDDWVRAAHRLLRDPGEGPFNVSAPEPVTEAGFVRALGQATGRRPRLAIPDAALAARWGDEMAHSTYLASRRVVPRRLSELGFVFAFPTLAEALADLFAPASGGP